MSEPEKNIFSILGDSFQVYVKNVKYLAIITLLAFVPVFVFRLLLPQHYAAAYADFINALLAGGDIYDIAALAASPLFESASTFALLYIGIELVFFPLSTLAATYLANKALTGEKPTFDGMFSATLPKFPKIIVTTAFAAAIAYLLLSFTSGFLGGFLMILTVYFVVGMVFYQQVVADVGRWGFSAIIVSRFFVRGRWFRVFFGSLVLFVCYFVISLALEFLGAFIGATQNVFIHLPFFLIQHFILSFFAIAFGLWYFDIKRMHNLKIKEIGNALREKMLSHMEYENEESQKEDDEV